MGLVHTGVANRTLHLGLPVRVIRPLHLHNRWPVQGNGTCRPLRSISSWFAWCLQLSVIWYRSWYQCRTQHGGK